ncbi:hypothetical protein GW17_00007718 [Ensete ventricosum]|nr:hypothetical protein GW17_00007718 [Ensete ventricosum]
MRLGTRLECVGSSPRLSRACQDGANDVPRSSLGIGPSSDDAVGPRQEFIMRFTEGIRKLAGNTSGDRQKKTIGLTARMPEAVELAKVRS